jgi:hypothetical protein
MSCVIEMGYRNTDGKGMKQSTSRPPYTVTDGVTTSSNTEKEVENWMKENKKRNDLHWEKDTIETARSWFDPKNSCLLRQEAN